MTHYCLVEIDTLEVVAWTARYSDVLDKMNCPGRMLSIGPTAIKAYSAAMRKAKKCHEHPMAQWRVQAKLALLWSCHWKKRKGST